MIPRSDRPYDPADIVLDKLTAATFAEHLHEPFRLDGGAAGGLVLELAEVSEAPDGARPFSVVFLGPGEPVLPQRIHRLEHEALGALELFIVPIGRDAAGVRYQAVFN